MNDNWSSSKTFDRASIIEMAQRENALAETRSREAASHEQPVGFDGHCPECGVEIPPPRITARYYVCVDCAARHEHRVRLGLTDDPT